MDFIEFLNKNTNNKYTFVKLTDVIYSKSEKVCTCKFVYNGEVKDLDESDKSLFSDLLSKYVGIDCEFNIKFKRESLDKEVLFQHISTFIQLYFPSAFSTFKPNNLEIYTEDKVVLKIKILDMYFDYLENRNFEKQLQDYLSKYYFKIFGVVVEKISSQNKLHQALEEQENLVQEIVESTNASNKVETFEVCDVRKLIGEELDTICRRYDSLKRLIKDVITAGTIKNIFERTFKSKTQKEEDGSPKEKAYYNIKLGYGEESLDCVYFPKDADLANFQTLNIDDDIVIFGDVEEYNQRTNFKVKGISLCKIEKIEETKIEYKSVNKEYKFVFPEEYVVNSQADLFTLNDVAEVNNVLKNNTFVVYDFETTGLNHLEEEIIEIGAVKVINGRVKETFSVLIKPSKEISQEITNLTGITNEMVENCLPMQDVIQDFYKFCYGSIMVGYNSIGFDNLFLQAAGRKYKYNFDMKQMDALLMARQYIKSVKNYKLKTIATFLNVTLDNAHRAVYDALATAEVFIKLTDYMENIDQ